jgi:hypothetical protein
MVIVPGKENDERNRAMGENKMIGPHHKAWDTEVTKSGGQPDRIGDDECAEKRSSQMIPSEYQS